MSLGDLTEAEWRVLKGLLPIEAATCSPLKDWRSIATRYDRCAHTFFSAICIAATIIFWINES